MDPLKRYLRPPSVLGWRFCLLIAAVCVATGWIAHRVVQAQAAADRGEARAHRTRAQMVRQAMPEQEKVEPAVAKRWAALQAERDFSWGDVFAAVEKAGSDDIELLAFEPDKPNHTIVLKGAARDQKALLVYLDALAQQPMLRNAHLTRQNSNKRERGEAIFFEVKAALLK